MGARCNVFSYVLKDYDALRTFCRGLLARTDRAKLTRHEYFFATWSWGDLSLKGDPATLRDGESFEAPWQACRFPTM
ncbi:MAG: hypothetical protein HKL90_03175 [Elusimicrobia bacterium]|nr:hypothetical protein [Elusimicrobiota bacterium]